MTDPNTATSRVLELADEFLDRYRRGQRPALGEYTARYPELAAEIREVFPAMAMMERIALADESIEGHRVPDPSKPRPRHRQLGDYRILREVGHGGMGVVYEAEQVSLGRHVALKVLPERLILDPKQRSRFEREAKAAARLHHTNIVPVFGVGEDDGTPYYAMQFITGLGLDQVLEELKRQRKRGKAEVGSDPAIRAVEPTAADVARSLLEGRLESGPRSPIVEDSSAAARILRGDDLTTDGPTQAAPPPAEPAHPEPVFLSSSSTLLGLGTASDPRSPGSPRPTYWRGIARIGAQVADALAYAHSQGILHRDVKPSNILLDARGTAWVADFGLAKIDDQQGLTHTGDILGTLRYMPPEAFEGRHDARGDVYSLGLSLYEMLAFRPAFDEAERGRLVRQVTSHEPPRLRTINPDVPRDLETIIQKAIERDPAHRYATAAILAEDLRRYTDDRPILARRASEAEKFRRWCRRNPAPAALLATLFLVFWAGFGLVTWKWREAVAEREAKQHALAEARDERTRALVAKGEEASARERAEADRARAESSRARADAAREAALAETYRASISEARALRAAHQPGWRDDALGNLARLATLPTPRRDLFELRTEAVACLGDFDIREVARVDTSKGVAFGLEFLADGPTLATAHRNGVVHLWDAAGPSHRAALPGKGSVGTWDFPSPGEPYPVARRRPDGQGLFYNPPGHGAVSLGPDLKPDRPPIDRDGMNSKALACDATGRRLAIGWIDDRVDVYEVATGSRLASVATADARASALSPDGLQLAVVGPGNAVSLRPVAGPRRVIPLGSHRQAIRALAFSPDGTTLASASDDHSVMLWDVARREARFPLRGHKGSVAFVSYSPDGEWIVTGGADFTVRVWESRSGRELAVLPQDQAITAVAISPGGDFLATSCIYSRWSSLYKITGRREIRRLAGHSAHVKAIAYNPKRARLVTGDEAGQLVLWDSTSGASLRKWQGHVAPANALAFSQDGSLLASGDYGSTLRLWDAASGSLLREIPGHRAAISALAFDRAGSRLIAGDATGRILVHEVASGTIPPIEVAYLKAWVHDIALTGDESGLLVQVAGGQLMLAALVGDALARSLLTREPGSNMVFDPGLSRAIVGETSGALLSVSVPALEPGVRVAGIHKERISRMALSPDGKLVASGSTDGQMVLSDSTSLRPLLKFPRRTGWVQALVFDSSGTQVAIGGLDADVEVWDFGLLRAGLEAVGLDWDRPAPTVEPGSTFGPQPGAAAGVVPLITADGLDPAERARALDLRCSGIQAFLAGRLAEAIVSLRDAVGRYRRFARANSDDPREAGELANVIGWLGGALAAAGRREEGLAATVESLTILEALDSPTPGELYDLACAYSRLNAATPADGVSNTMADRAVATLRRSIDAGLPSIQSIAGDTDFDSIRGRADFQALLLDRQFPRDPFARP